MWPALIFPPFLSCRAPHPLLIQTLKISFQTQLAFSPSKCRCLWCFFSFHPLWTFPLSLPDKDHYWGYWKGVLIIYRRKHIKGPFSGPIRRLLKPTPRQGYQCYWEPLIHSFATSFFNYILRQGFHCSRARPRCCYLFFVKLSTAELAKRGRSSF